MKDNWVECSSLELMRRFEFAEWDVMIMSKKSKQQHECPNKWIHEQIVKACSQLKLSNCNERYYKIQNHAKKLKSIAILKAAFFVHFKGYWC
ncbi:unnamed protein product [Ambrosiozyma monospora]|uniref:Unnamed protein product n=1 Tax=Ambrosiozyma monospora TaxID=43982 RepID=A0A9W7DDI0_AMBMO|nr:unnamed protein product [Ambrosiozyma monospora]